MRLLLAVALVALPLTLGCSSDDSGSGDGPAKCEKLLDTWCSHAVDCMISTVHLTESERQTNYDICMDSAKEGVDCGSVIGVGSSYDQCITDIEAIACSTYSSNFENGTSMSLPPTCKGVMLTQAMPTWSESVEPIWLVVDGSLQ